MYDTAVHISAQLLAANIHARKDQAAQSSRIAFFWLPIRFASCLVTSKRRRTLL
jgi:hypothetical protein